MALTIGTNNAALNAAASASRVNRGMEISMARLSTGKRINSASDDAAGVAISSRLSVEIRGTDQAIRNSLDGQALIDTAEGAHKEVENILQRMREIAVQAANDTNNSDDRANLSSEMEALSNEIDRVAATTTWAGQSLFSGGSENPIPSGSEGASKEYSFQIGSGTASPNQLRVNIAEIDTTALGLNNSENGSTPTAFIYMLIDTNLASVIPTADQAEFEEYFNMTIADSTLADGAVVALGFIDWSLERLNIKRASLGALFNRLSHTINNLTNISSNLSAAKGGIEDADFALETTQLAKNQILQQASTAMLAQANASKQNVLSLLQG